jgi:hypothetical protein
VNRLPLAGCFVALGFLATPAFAQEAGPQQESRESQQVVEAQQQQIEALRKQIESLTNTVEAQALLLQQLQAQLEALVVAAEAGAMPLAPEEPPAVPATEPAEEPVTASAQRGARVSERGRYDLESPTASNVTYFDPAASAMIPDAKTEVAVHGLLEFQILHDTVGLNNNRFDTVTIPVDGGPPQTKFNVNPTQFAASSSTQVAPDQRFNTWFSIDMNGQLDRPQPRLRVAFGEYVNDTLGLGVLAGQTYSTMLDLRAIPETLDFALPAGLWQQRQPLLRVSKSLSDSLTAEVSVETPENVVYFEAQKLTRWPDFVAAAIWHADGDYIKHLRLAGLARDLWAEGEDGSTDSALGWALSGSTKLGLPFLGARDNLKLTMHYGDGYGTQLKGGPIEGVFRLDSPELETIGVFGTYGGLQHFWSDHFRSNLVYGYVEARNPDSVDPSTLKNTTYVAADFIWSPFPTTKFGFEYLWGRREDQDGESGTTNRFLWSSMFVF